MKRKGAKFKIGIALIIIEAVVYISALMGYGDGIGISYIYSFSHGDIVGGIIDFVTFDIFGLIGIALVLSSRKNHEKTK